MIDCFHVLGGEGSGIEGHTTARKYGEGRKGKTELPKGIDEDIKSVDSFQQVKDAIVETTGAKAVPLGYQEDLGMEFRFDFPNNVSIYTNIDETEDQVLLTIIDARKTDVRKEKAKGSGKGTQVVLALKRYAEETGKQLVIPSATKSALSYWDRFDWLKKDTTTSIPWEGGKVVMPDTYSYKPIKNNSYHTLGGEGSGIEGHTTPKEQALLKNRKGLLKERKNVNTKPKVTKDSGEPVVSPMAGTDPGSKGLIEGFSDVETGKSFLKSRYDAAEKEVESRLEKEIAWRKENGVDSLSPVPGEVSALRDYRGILKDQNVKNVADTILKTNPFTKDEMAILMKSYSSVIGPSSVRYSLADEDTNTTRNIVNGVIATWSGSSADSSIRAIEMQMAVANVMGMPEVAKERLISKMEKAFSNVPESDESDQINRVGSKERIAALQKVAQAIYDNTQADLTMSGIKDLVLYRGTEKKELHDLQTRDKGGQVFEFASNPISSWSADRKVAEDFAYGASSNAGIMVMKVPAKSIFSMATSGMGCAGEFEVIVLSAKGQKARAYNTERNVV